MNFLDMGLWALTIIAEIWGSRRLLLWLDGRFALARSRPGNRAGLPLVWLVWALGLLSWAGYLRSVLGSRAICPLPHHPLRFSLTCLFSLSAVPHRTYPLSCCLLD